MSYDDKTMMTDMLSTQKFITSNYNNYAGECATKQSKAKLMKILAEEHDIQYKIFESMSAKGWYPTPPAPADKINEAVQTHVNGATNLKKTEKTTAVKKTATAKAPQAKKTPLKNAKKRS